MVFFFYFHSMVCEQYAHMCELLEDEIYNGDEGSETDLELQQLRALCDTLQSNQSDSNNKDIDSLPDFDLTRIDSGNIIEIKLMKIMNQFYRRRYE